MILILPFRCFRRIPTQSTIRIAILMATQLICLQGTPAAAELREYLVTFSPSSSPSVMGYFLHFGPSTGNYTNTNDIGAASETAGGALVHRAMIDHDGDLFMAISAYDTSGGRSPFSQEARVSGSVPSTPPSDLSFIPTPQLRTGDTPVDVLPAWPIGLSADQRGLIREVRADGEGQVLSFNSLAGGGDVRAARCDLDGDGDEDILLGLGSGSDGQILLVHLQQGRVDEYDQIQAGTSFYRSVDGQTRPACGDIDGDGRVEIVVGFGTAAGTRVQVLDDSEHDYLPMSVQSRPDGMLRVPRSPSANFGGLALFPALGDIDGDGRDELVIGYGSGDRAEIAVLDDYQADFEKHPHVLGDTGILRIEGPHEAGLGFATRPALGDWDGDGRDEIAVGFGAGSRSWIAFLEDAFGAPYGSTSIFRMLQVGRFGHRLLGGEAWPALADVNGDGRDDLVVGFAGLFSSEIQIVSVPTDGPVWTIQDSADGFFLLGDLGTQRALPVPANGP